MSNSMSVNIKTAFSIIKRTPWTLFGLILLGSVLTGLSAFCGVLVPIISFPVSWVVGAGLCMMCLKSVRYQEVSSKDIFDGFNNFKHVACGMAWKNLWVYIWVIAPIIVFFKLAGRALSTIFDFFMEWFFVEVLDFGSSFYDYFGTSGVTIREAYAAVDQLVIWIVVLTIAMLVCVVFAIIKAIQYSFTPYILMDKPEIHPTDALKKSKEMTMGLRGGIFGAMIIPILIIGGIGLVISLLSKFSYIGIIFSLIYSVYNLAATAFMVIYMSLVMASYYNNAAAGVPVPGAIPLAYYGYMPNNGYNGYPNQTPNGYPTYPTQTPNGYSAYPNQAPDGYAPYPNQEPNVGCTQPIVSEEAVANNDGEPAVPTTEEVNDNN